MPRLILDGKEYPIPALNELTLGEGIVFERFAGLTVGELQQRDPEHTPLSVLKALGVIAIRRARNDVSEHEASVAIDEIPFEKLREAFPQPEKKPDPLDRTPESETDDSPGPSGQDSSSDGEASPDSPTPEASGDLASEPSASVPRISAA